MPGVNMFGGTPPPQNKPSSNNAGVNMFGVAQDAQQVDLPQNEAQADPQTNPQELPNGAKGFDESGKPVFADNLSGMLKKWQYNFTKDVKEVTADDWQQLKDRWNKAKNPQYVENGRGKAMTGNLTPEEQAKVQSNKENAATKVAGEAISKAFQAGQSDGSLLSPVLKATSASVVAITDLFSMPARLIEQGAGALQGFEQAANSVDSIMPRLDQNKFTKALEDTPIGLAYDFARLAFSPSDDKWDVAQKDIEEGWHSGRVLYSQIFDSTLKEKFLQEYRAGGDPQLLAEKMQNPLAELGGQLILDPLNLVGAFAKSAKTAKELNAAMDSVKASGLMKTEEGAQALKMIVDASDDRSAVEALKTLTLAQQKAVKEVQTGSKLLNVTYDASSLTTSSRQNAIIGKGKELLGNMALLLKNNGMSYDGIAEGILHGIRSVSGVEDEMRMGLSGLAKLPNANMWLSDDYIETFTMMHKLMAGEDGLVSGARLTGLMKAKNPAEFAEVATKMLVAAAKSELPDVGELAKAAELAKTAAKTGVEVGAETLKRAEQYNALPNHVKYLDKVNTALSTYIKNPINKVLSPLYFNLQGGVAVKNVIANSELVFLDKGIKAWVRDGEYLSAEKNINYLKNVFGEMPSSAHGFESLVGAATGQDNALDFTKLASASFGEKAKMLAQGFKKQGFGVLMNIGEEEGASRIVAASVRDTMQNMIPKAFGDTLKTAIKDGALTEKQADRFTKMVIKNGGNIEQALNDYRDFYKVGAVEAWRNLDFVTDFQRQALDKLGYWDEIEQLAQDGAASQADIEKVFQKISTSIDSRSEMAVNDVIALSSDHPGAPAWGDLMKAVEDGHLDPNDQQVFTAIMESAEQARLEYQGLLDDVVLKATTALSQEGRVQEAQKIGKEMNRVRDILRKAGPETAKEAQAITQDAWRWSDAIKDEKKLTPEKLVEFWNKAGLNGAPPLDLNKKTLLNELWKQRFDNVKAAWNGSFDALVGESETVLKQMEGVVDATELKSMATRTRNITEQAQAYRSAVYDGKALRIKQNKSVLDLAHEYGLATAKNSGVKNDQSILAIINKYSGEYGSGKVKDLALATTAPRTDLPGNVSQRVADEARRLLSELTGGEAGRQTAAGVTSSSNVEWYRQMTAETGLGKTEISKALEKIIAGEGDKGKTVEKLKETIFANFMHGDSLSGTPPDLAVLKEMGANNEQLKTALNAFNDITGQDLTMQDALKASGGIRKQFTNINEVPADVARAAFDKQRVANGLEPLNAIDDLGVAIPPPHPLGSDPSFPRAWNESAKGAKYTLDTIKNKIMENWGKTDDARKFDPKMEAALRNAIAQAEPRMGEIKAAALKVATEQRNFTLLNYGERTYADVAKSYIMPYHFFYTRSYKNWMSRLATNPDILAGYAKYKNSLEDINKDLPDWYKQQLNINPLAGMEQMQGKKLLGMDISNPLYINLEASLNPLYGLTGTDYNDPAKRVDWTTATIDDLGKFGPTIWAPIQLGIAAKLYMDGETDAASRWGNRLIPETAQIKSVTSLFGKPLELDPAVRFFSGGIEATDRGRMGYAAAELINNGEFTSEEIQFQFQQQKGPAWDRAYQMAVQSRTASSISSYFLGVGFKPRGQNDVMVEEMYTKLNKLYTMSDMMSTDQYKTAWEQLRSQYPDGLVDTVLLAKKGGAKRDAAYAFSVLGRLPPTEMTQLFKDIGIGDKDVQKFYDSKGFSDPKVKFTETEKARFMAAIIDLGAMLKIPDSATRTEWNSVRTMYADDLKDISAQVGIPYSGKDKGVWDLVSHYYDLKDANPNLADQFTKQHPEVMLAMQLKQQAIAESPLLAAYYGGIDSIEAYVSGKVRQELSDKYGPEIYQLQSEYFMTENQKAFMRQHPELKQFFDDKKKMDAEADQMFLSMAGKLPNIKPAQFQAGYTPESGVQDTLYNNLQPQGQFPQWEEVSANLPNWMINEISAYVQNGEKISNRAKNEMGFLASQAGFANANDYLQNAALAYQQYLYQPQQAPQSAGVNMFGVP